MTITSSYSPGVLSKNAKTFRDQIVRAFVVRSSYNKSLSATSVGGHGGLFQSSLTKTRYDFCIWLRKKGYLKKTPDSILAS